jgi:hypothetical protein
MLQAMLTQDEVEREEAGLQQRWEEEEAEGCTQRLSG